MDGQHLMQTGEHDDVGCRVDSIVNELFRVGLDLRTSRDLSDLADHVQIDLAMHDLDTTIRRLQLMMLARAEDMTAPRSPISDRALRG